MPDLGFRCVLWLTPKPAAPAAVTTPAKAKVQRPAGSTPF